MAEALDDAVTMVGGRLALVAGPGLDAAFLARIRAIVHDRDPFASLVRAMADAGLDSVPSLAAAATERGGVRILVRGAAKALAKTVGGGSELVTSRGKSTWAEHAVSGVQELVLVAANGAGKTTSVVLFLDPSEQRPARRSAGASAAAVEPLGAPRFEVGDAPEDEDLGALLGDTRRGAHFAAPSTPPVDLPQGAPPTVVVPVLDDGDHDGNTISVADLRAVLDLEPLPPTPPRVATPAPFDYDAPAPSFESPSFDPPTSVVAPSFDPPPSFDSPSFGPPPVGAPTFDPPTAVVASVPPTFDPPTIDRSQVGPDGPALPASPPRGPTVQAVLCPEGHPNPPQVASCRGCGRPVQDRSIHVVARPSLGRITFDDGTVAEVDRPLILGRRPTYAPGQAEGADPPRLVTLPDGEQGLSRVHAEVRVSGWEVLVVDRDSMNGTVVQLPGEPPTRLRPGEPVLIVPGTRLDLGGAQAGTFDLSVL